VPLSEEEQRILHEMEQKLYEHDREFADRVSHSSNRLHAPRAGRWSIVVFVAGFALLLTTFRFSTALGAIGFFLMLAGLLLFAQHVRDDPGARRPAAPGGRSAARTSRRGVPAADRGRAGLAGDWSQFRRRFRSRFGNRA